MYLYFIFCRKKHKTSWQIDALLRFLYREIFHENDCCGRFSRSHVSKMWEAQPTIDSFEFSSQKTEQRILHTFWHFFYKNWSYQQRSKGRPPHLLLLPILRSPWTRIFWWFWLKAQKLLMELCMKIKMRKSLYQFYIVNKMLCHIISQFRKHIFRGNLHFY